jgi:hypothetical protein
MGLQISLHFLIVNKTFLSLSLSLMMKQRGVIDYGANWTDAAADP